MGDARSAESLLRTVIEAAGRGRRARHVRVLVGDGSGVRPVDLEMRFREIALGTPAEEAALEFIAEPLAARCARCGEAFRGSGLSCPRCGSADLRFTAGTTAAVLTVDVDAQPPHAGDCPPD